MATYSRSEGCGNDVCKGSQQSVVEGGSKLGFSLTTESYSEQTKRWPKDGKHILAQFDDKNIVVYQAFKPSIAEYAVHNQRFGGPDYSFTRMSWIKTNFLWMMYRCGWAKKRDQQRILAITITREGFEKILENAYTASLQKSKNLTNDEIQVRLQWDPDHYPDGNKVEGRKAIQLGLKGQILSKFTSEWLVRIDDITDFVCKQHKLLTEQGQWKIETPKEQVYPLLNENIGQKIDLDFYDHSGPKFVS
ncbi:hypothetical protein LOTGIDRAFT_203752 [Lottia gigantea]|uniref:DUF4291 domain-containing protein n=1 Tax=Lottia gigantea TaxID=225164 RepID=V4AJZ4_LOTGI|nr:hypothetical protein LOTGIDRAFT_203752 [Lottia gigantea]ESO97412.1 hypothetical protein LOTGIDRAFT_203752 [Lottia gigantea]